MASYIVLALNGPKPGEDNDQAYNAWYEQQHLPELLGVDGIDSGRRFRVFGGTLDFGYATIYEINTDDFEGTMKAMAAASSPFPPSFDPDKKASLIAVEVTGQ